MIPHTSKKEQQVTATHVLDKSALYETPPTEEEILVQWGFTSHEIASLLWLRQWYQSGGSDRAAIVRYLEFLRLLVRTSELEL